MAVTLSTSSQLDKVFNLGLPKSGTTTLGQALKHAGYRVADWRVRGRGFIGEMMYRAYFNGLDPVEKLSDFDAFTQLDIIAKDRNFWPQCDYGMLSAIREFHPEAKFIMSHRDPEKLSDSMFRWSNLGKRRLGVNFVPGLPLGYGRKDSHRIRWIEGHYKFVRKVFAGDSGFLEYDVEDPEAPTKIGAFLGQELPWWGRANENVKVPVDESEA
jgi:sulfotransferase family protein